MALPCSGQLDCQDVPAWTMQSCVEQVCKCTAIFGHSGPNCDLPPPTAPVNAGVTAAPVGLGLLLMGICGRTLIDTLTVKGVFKFNAAGRTYILAWCGFIVAWIGAGLSILLAFDRDVYPYVLALDNIAIVFLLSALLSITSTFIRLTTVRVMRKVPLYTQKVFWAMIVISVALVSVFYLVDWRIYSFVCYFALAIAGVCGGVFPLVLFIRSAERNPGMSKPQILRAAFSEYIMRNGASVHFFGFDSRRASMFSITLRQSSKNSRAESGGDDSVSPRKPSKDRVENNTQSLNKPNGSEQTMVRTLSMTSFQTQPADRAMDKALFFFRLIHLGANISIFMTGFVGFWISYLIFVAEETAHGSVFSEVSLAVVLWSLRSCCLLCLCFSMIAFTQRLYRKRVLKIAEEKAMVKPEVDVQVNEETRLQIAPWLVQADTLAKDINIKTVKSTSTRRLFQPQSVAAIVENVDAPSQTQTTAPLYSADFEPNSLKPDQDL